MTEDNSRGHSTPATTNSATDPPASAPKKRIEELLLEDEPPRTTFRELADQEVKSGNSVDHSLLWPLVVFALLIVAVVGVVVGWYQVGNLLTGEPATGNQIHVEQRIAVPERSQPQEAAQQTIEDAPLIEDEIAATATAEQASAGGGAEVATKEAAEATAASPSEAVATPATDPVVSEDDVVETVLIAAEVVVSQEQQVAAESPAALVAEPVHRVLVGPFISQRDFERAAARLRERGFEPEQQHGSGTVDMIRLLEGIYPLVQAQQRLEEVRKEFPSAFLLPDGGRWALYIGSFSDRERARRQQRELAERQIQVAPVDSQLTMEGPLLIVVRSGLQAAEEVAAEVNASGLRARIEIER